MKICLITSSSVNDLEENLERYYKNDLVVLGFNGLGLVSYKKELDGETEYFRDVAKLSKELSTVIICGCDTDTYGVFRHSAVIADKGKIIGVTDTVYQIDESEYVSGGAFKVYDTSAGKIGIIVGEDLFFPEISRVLSLCDADVIVCVFSKIENQMPQLSLRCQAFYNGVPMLLCAKNYATATDIRGNILIAGGSNVVNTQLKIEKNYRQICSKRRGLIKNTD